MKNNPQILNFVIHLFFLKCDYGTCFNTNQSKLYKCVCLKMKYVFTVTAV